MDARDDRRGGVQRDAPRGGGMMRALKNLRRAALAALAALAVMTAPAGAQQGPQANYGLLNAAATSSACTSQSCVSLAITPLATQVGCWIEVTGTFSGTMVVEGSIGGSQWVSANITPYGGLPQSQQTTITTTGLYETSCAPNMRVRMSAYTSGGAAVQLYAANLEPLGAITNDQSIPFWQANAPGGGCSGQTSNGTTITSANVTQSWTTTTTTLVIGLAGKTTHVCDFEISGVPTTGGTLTVYTGSSANCAANTTAQKNYTIGVSAAGIIIGFNNGGADLFAVPSGYYVCLGGASFAGTITANATYAQY